MIHFCTFTNTKPYYTLNCERKKQIIAYKIIKKTIVQNARYQIQCLNSQNCNLVIDLQSR